MVNVFPRSTHATAVLPLYSMSIPLVSLSSSSTLEKARFRLSPGSAKSAARASALEMRCTGTRPFAKPETRCPSRRVTDLSAHLKIEKKNKHTQNLDERVQLSSGHETQMVCHWPHQLAQLAHVYPQPTSQLPVFISGSRRNNRVEPRGGCCVELTVGFSSSPLGPWPSNTAKNDPAVDANFSCTV